MTKKNKANEKPIIFSTAMVQAILDGKKVQTRRVLVARRGKWKGQTPLDVLPMKTPNEWITLMQRNPNHGEVIRCRYGSAGTVLWMRETWRTGQGLDNLPPRLSGEGSPYQYKADMATIREDDVTKHSPWGKWRPSIHMPRWACRLFLKVKDIRVERVQDITEEDAEAEGAQEMHLDDLGQTWKTHRRGFQTLWDTINAKRGYLWDTNPWVWRIEFEVMKDGKPKTV